jgi:alkanesulfonate monooxygenase SsuD/methylene tetrahydromethanopterin reductase-like flavin-dependent oxidoreductase (luciferase family)
MPWPHLPGDFAERYETAWVTLPNGLFDPVEGQRLYGEYLDQLEYAEQLGFDGVCVNEHHQTAYGLMPCPNIMAATLARRTSRVKIAIVGNALPLRDHPQRVAEETAMLDLISGGRMICGLVRGIGDEYASYAIDPSLSRERFLEAHDLLLKIWTEPGPFRWEGKHYDFRYVNVWPRPLQQPHPPIWVPTQASGETIRWAAERRYPVIIVYIPTTVITRRLEEYRQAARDFGYEAAPDQLGWLAPIYVAHSDEQARAEAEPHLLYLFHTLLRHTREFLFPPGYLTEAGTKRMAEGWFRGDYAWGARSFEEFCELGCAVVGSPETVRRRLGALCEELGVGLLLPLLQFGSLPHDLAMRNMELFAREVMPALRPLNSGAPVGAGR